MIGAFLKKELILTKRYLMNSLINYGVIFFIFVLIYYGMASVVGNFLDTDTATAVMLSYLSWIIALSAYQTVSHFILEESSKGTIQTLYMSRTSFPSLVLQNVLATSLFDLAAFFILMFLCAKVTETDLNIDLLFALIVVFVSFGAYWGIGLTVGGLALVHKRVSSLDQVVTWALMAVMLLPMVKIEKTWFLPGGYSRMLLAKIVGQKASITDLAALDWLQFIGVNLLYLALGFLIFRFFLKKAVKQGSIGHI